MNYNMYVDTDLAVDLFLAGFDKDKIDEIVKKI